MAATAGYNQVSLPGTNAQRAGTELSRSCLRYVERGVVHWYQMYKDHKYVVERVQTGVRIEKRLLKVLRAFADFHDLSLGDLLEGIVLHAFDGKCPFNQDSLGRIKELKKFYGLELDSSASHRLSEAHKGGVLHER